MNPDQAALFGASDVDKVLEPTAGRMHRNPLSTEREAAEKVSLRSSSQKAKVLMILARLGDAIPHQLHVEAGCAAPHVATTRLEDLEDLGLVERTAERRLTPWNGKAQVWRCTDRGREVAAELAARVAA